MNGNLLTNGTEVLIWNDENELVTNFVAGSWQSVFVYDGKMRRKVEQDYSWNGSAWTETNEIHFIYDGNIVIQERDINNLSQATYTRGNDLSQTLQGAGGIGGLLARTANSQLLTSSSFAHAYYHADGNGNVTFLIYTNQMIAAKYLYDPFGNTLSMSGPLADANRYRFSSKEWNDNAGLYYYLYRFYDPNLQRWPNRDPIHEFGFLKLKGRKMGFHENAELNLYAFVGNGPIYRVDPLGLSHRLGGLAGGKCCNKTSSDEWWIDDGVWKKLPAGKCTGTWDDCDGFTCDRGFYAVSDLDSHSCDSNTRCSKWGQDHRWTPNGSGPYSTAPGPAYPGDDPGRGGPVGNPYPGGGTWGDWP